MVQSNSDLKYVHNLSLQIFIDGVSSWKKSKETIYPVYMVFSSLNRKDRFKLGNVLLIGLISTIGCYKLLSLQFLLHAWENL